MRPQRLCSPPCCQWSSRRGMLSLLPTGRSGVFFRRRSSRLHMCCRGGAVSVTTLVAVTLRHGRVTRLGGGAFPLRNMLLAPRLETMRGPTRSLLALVPWTRANSQVQVPNDLLQRRDASEYRSLPSPAEAVASCEVSGRHLTFASSARVAGAGREFCPHLLLLRSVGSGTSQSVTCTTQRVACTHMYIREDGLARAPIGGAPFEKVTL